VVQLCVLFNTMMQCSVVPETFHAGIVVPVLKDKRGDATDINNYRAVTLSSCISKLFKMCILELYGDMLSTSSLQFGFKKKLGLGMLCMLCDLLWNILSEMGLL